MQNKRKSEYDFSLLFVVIFLSCFGLIMVYSASYYTARVQGFADAYYLKKQAIWYLIGIPEMIAVSLIPYQIWERHQFLTLLAYVGSVGIMILTNFTSLGKELNGKKRWLKLPGGQTVQSAEIVKVALILMIALLMVRMGRQLDEWRGLILIAVLAGVPILLVFMNNLSSAIIISLIVILMVFVPSKRKKLFLWVFLGAAALALIIVLLAGKVPLLQGYQMKRILVWKDPLAYAEDDGYQVVQGFYAIGSGGLFGKGLGNGIQKLGFVPEASNDMIFSIVCEELGLFGAFLIILLFVFMLYRMLMIVVNAPDRFGAYIVLGVMSHIGVQVILHIAVVTGAIPNTGVTLPFISYGGSSVLFLMAELGLVLNVSKQIRYGKE